MSLLPLLPSPPSSPTVCRAESWGVYVRLLLVVPAWLADLWRRVAAGGFEWARGEATTMTYGSDTNRPRSLTQPPCVDYMVHALGGRFFMLRCCNCNSRENERWRQ